MGTTFTFDSLMQAAIECSRGVSWKFSVANWVHPRNIATNCLTLLDELDSGIYKLSPYSVFKITSPKPREIKAPKFRDRVVQRAMCNLGLYRDLTRDCIYDNAACLKGKGTRFAMNRLSCLMQRFWREHGMDGWVLRLDIKKFFDSIPHDKLKAMVDLKVSNTEFSRLVMDVIDSFPDDCGIGLGSQLSQLLAISYLSPYDHRIKEYYKVRAYERYSDDIVMIHPDKEFLHSIWTDSRDFLSSLGLSLNAKSSLSPLRHGIDFMKFKFRLTDGGGIVRIIDSRNVVRARRRMRRMTRLFRKGKLKLDDINASFSSWRSHALAGDTHGIIRSVQCLIPSF